jgi:hypothetical protein
VRDFFLKISNDRNFSCLDILATAKQVNPSKSETF